MAKTTGKTVCELFFLSFNSRLSYRAKIFCQSVYRTVDFDGVHISIFAYPPPIMVSLEQLKLWQDIFLKTIVPIGDAIFKDNIVWLLIKKFIEGVFIYRIFKKEQERQQAEQRQRDRQE